MVNKVTFTGVDNHTDILELQKITDEYPFAEFGVLMSQNNTGIRELNRFPDPQVIKAMSLAGIPCSAHICGNLARHTVKTGDFSQIEKFLEENGAGKFNRIQLNIRGYDKYKHFVYKGAVPVIIQVSDEKSVRYYNGLRLESENIQALFDASGGHGISGLDGGFDLGFDAGGYVGFAGGLNPDNVAFALGYITSGRINKPVSQDFWIDMESGIRTDDWFDTEKVRTVCKIVAQLMN